MTLEHAIGISSDLLRVNAIATQALADQRAHKPITLELAHPRSQPLQDIYRMALPPLKRIKPGADLPGHRRGAQQAVHLPLQPTASEFRLPAETILSCDGSFTNGGDEAAECSGWGFTVASPSLTELKDYCGTTILDPHDPGFIGARRHTNNVGELSAMFFALSWAQEYISSSSSSSSPSAIVIEYDSEYAAGVARRRIRGRANCRLVLRLRHIYDQVAGHVIFRKVESHTGVFLNERADQLAGCGASGIVCGLADTHRWACSSS